MKKALLVLSLVLVFTVNLYSGIKYVTATGSGAGASWADATSFQSALTAAISGDQIWVAKGTYKPTLQVGGTGARYQTFQMKSGVAIYGGFAGIEGAVSDRITFGAGQANETILSGDLNGDDNYLVSPWTGTSENCYHVFYNPSGLDLTSILDGFTIKGGNANGSDFPHYYGGGMFNYFSSSPTLTNCTFSSNSAGGGGGMYNYSSSSPTLTNCTFSSNTAEGGGGMGNSGSSSPTLTNCIFTSNSATYDDGGGMNNSYSSPTLTNCTFTSNSATNVGASTGGGMYNFSSSPTFTNCTFTSNSASLGGGGMRNDYSSSPTFTNCTFSSNSVSNGGGGGGMDNSSSSPTFTNCTFSLNSATNYGGGMCNSSSSPILTNCIFSSNSARYDGGGMYNNSSSPNLTNCTFTSNSTVYGYGGGMDNSYSSSPIITNCTFSSNSANQGGGAMHNSSSSLSTNNCIIWGNEAIFGDEFYIDGGTTTLNYSCYANATGDVYIVSGTLDTTNNNITSDPLFVGSSINVTHPYSIPGNSPCVDVGNGSYNLQDYDIRGAGYPRKLSIAGGVGTIDMGAYEYKVGTDPLPVELTSFAASANGAAVTLNWQTATEVNNYGFEIERRTVNIQNPSISSPNRGGLGWGCVGFVKGSGTSNAPKKYSYSDTIGSTCRYVYRLKQIDNDGSFKYSQSVEVTIQAPAQFALAQNYPNPFNPSTTFHVALPAAGEVKLVVMNILGQEVAEVVNKHLEAGTYDFSWNAKNLSSGIYFFKLTSNQFSSVRKMTLLK